MYARFGPRSLLLSILLLAFALRMFVALNNLDTPLGSDESDYLERATRVSADFLSDRTVFRPPLYSYALAVWITLVGDERFSINAYQVLLDVLNVALMYVVSRLLIARRDVSILAAFLFAVFPTAIGLTSSVLSDTQFICLFLTGLVLLLYVVRRPQLALAGLAGIFFALAALTREVAAYFGLIVIPAWVLLFTRNALSKRILLSAVFFVGMVLLLSPWAIRNTIIEERFLLLSSSSEFNFARDNVRVAIMMGKEPGHPTLTPNQQFFAELDAQPSSQRAAYAYWRGFEAIRQTGWYWVGSKAQSLGAFWNPFHFEKANLGISELPSGLIPVASLGITSSLIALMVLGTLGLIGAPDTSGKLLVALFLLYSFGIFMLTHYQLRYRYPLHVLMIPYAAYGIWIVSCLMRTRRFDAQWIRAPRFVVSALVVALFVPLIVAGAS